MLREWLEVRTPLPGTHVFCVLRGKTVGSQWSDTDVRRIMRELGDSVLGRRLNPGSLRYTLIAELIIEQWPLPYIETQLGFQSFYALREIFPKLGIGRAPGRRGGRDRKSTATVAALGSRRHASIPNLASAPSPTSG